MVLLSYLSLLKKKKNNQKKIFFSVLIYFTLHDLLKTNICFNKKEKEIKVGDYM